MMIERSGGNYRSSSDFPRRPVPFSFDFALIQQVEEMSSGETVHQSANLVGACRAAWSGYGETGDPEFLALAEEAERQLRILLHEFRWQRAALVCWL